MALRFKISIRWKIIGLIVGALTFSLAGTLYVSTSLLIDDKTAYIYDFNLSQVKLVAERVNSKIGRVSQFASLVGSSFKTGNLPPVEAAYNSHAADLGIDGLMVLTPLPTGQFRVEGAFGGSARLLQTVLDQAGWNPKLFEDSRLLLGTEAAGKLPVGIQVTAQDGSRLCFLTLLKMDREVGTEDKSLSLLLVDSLGNRLLGNDTDQAGLDPLVQSLLRGSFESGVREWGTGPKALLVSYQKLQSSKLLALSLIPKNQAYAAAKVLTVRIVFVGISILFLAVGLTIAFGRKLTSRIGQMWSATQNVSQGDFSSRVAFGGKLGDELDGLAASFNAMADKIDYLMVQTAEKVRMAKELETAQLLQKRFMPARPFSHANLRLSGQCLPATECAGDWWHYSQLGSFLIVAVGDVTGHGVSAALLTAAAHASFSCSINRLDKNLDPSEAVKEIVRELNRSVRAAAGGEAEMTLFISIVDLATGQVTMASASHHPPYFLRTVGARSKVTAFMKAQSPALGQRENLNVEPDVFQLEPGDVILWYTDGLIDTPASKSRLVRLLGQLKRSPDLDATAFSNTILEKTFGTSGGKLQGVNLNDDVTVIVGYVPQSADFTRAAKAA